MRSHAFKAAFIVQRSASPRREQRWGMSFTLQGVVLVPECAAKPMVQSVQRSDAEPVIQIVKHDDPPAVRDTDMLELQADMQWAAHIELRIQDGAALKEQPAQLASKVHLISFRSGKSELFRKMLLEDAEFKPLRQRLHEAGYTVVLQPSGVTNVYTQQ